MLIWKIYLSTGQRSCKCAIYVQNIYYINIWNRQILLWISCETSWLLCQHCWCERAMRHGTFAGCKVRLVPTRCAHSLHFTANSPSLLFHVWCQKEPCLWFDACFIEQMFLQGCLWSRHVASIKMAEGMEPALITTVAALMWKRWFQYQ